MSLCCGVLLPSGSIVMFSLEHLYILIHQGAPPSSCLIRDLPSSIMAALDSLPWGVFDLHGGLVFLTLLGGYPALEGGSCLCNANVWTPVSLWPYIHICVCKKPFMGTTDAPLAAHVHFRSGSGDVRCPRHRWIGADLCTGT